MRLPSFITNAIPNATSSPTTSDPENGLRRPVPSHVDRDPHIQAVLTEFRHAVGIHDDPDLIGGDGRQPNLGIYKRIVKYENTYKSNFQTFSWLINAALGLQIVFAAALTALGAGNGPRSAVTAFGALNTIIAAFLTYLKGSGLPNRFSYYKQQNTDVREYIEQREREIARGDPNVDVRHEIWKIEQMYNEVKKEIELNTPEAYVSRTKEASSLSRYDRDSPRGRANERYDDFEEKLGSVRGSVRPQLESRLSGLRTGAESRIHEARSGLDNRLNSVRYGLESRLSQRANEVHGQMYDAERGLNVHYNTTRTDLDNKMTEARGDIDSHYQDTRAGISNQYQSTRAGIDSQINTARVATAAQVEDTRHGLENRIEDTRTNLAHQVEDSRHDVESRMKEVQAQVKEQEEKIMGIAESVAQKVLSVTQKRHEHDPK